MKEQIERYFTHDLSNEEEIELLRKVSSDKEFQAEFSKQQNIQGLLSFSDRVVDSPDSKRAYKKFLLGRNKQRIYTIVRKSFGYAAGIISIIMLVHLYHLHTYSFTAPIVGETSLFVPAGQRVSLTLTDGTVVWLNSQTRLTYPTVFGDNERRVAIEGEGYFEVIHDEKKPFIVTSREVDIKVLGTTFNVVNYQQEGFSRISLIEGSIQVYDPLFKTEGVILKPNEEVTITEGNMVVSNISDISYFLWKDGLYSFDNEELGIILRKLELYYDIEIRVKEPSILKWKYTVKFRQRDGIDEILRLMQKVHPFRIQKDADNNLIVISK